jgi:hypothetical protein
LLGEQKNEDGVDLDKLGLFLKTQFDLTNKNMYQVLIDHRRLQASKKPIPDWMTLEIFALGSLVMQCPIRIVGLILDTEVNYKMGLFD